MLENQYFLKCVCLAYGDGWKGDLYDMDEKFIRRIWCLSQKQRKTHIWKKHEKIQVSICQAGNKRTLKNVDVLKGLTLQTSWMVVCQVPLKQKNPASQWLK